MIDDRHLWDIRPVRDLALLAVGVMVLWMVYLSRSVMGPIAVAIVLAYIFNPLVTWANRKCKLPRQVSAGIIIAMVLLAVGGFVAWAVPNLVRQINQMVQQLPHYLVTAAAQFDIDLSLESLQQVIRDTAQTKLSEADGSGAISEYVGPVASVIKGIVAFLVSLIGSIVRLVTYLPVAVVIIGFCFFFFSWHWAAIVGWFDQFIPVASRAKTLDVLGKMDRTVSAFIRGRLIQALVMGLILSVGWWIAGVPYWLLLGMGCGLLNLVPFMAVIGWGAALALASVDHLSGTWQVYHDALVQAQAAGIDQATVTRAGFRIMVIIGPSIVYFLAQGLDSWVVEPMVQGRATNLDPLTVLLAVMIGGNLAGLLGMVLAIPVAACIKILGRELLVPKLRAYAQRTA